MRWGQTLVTAAARLELTPLRTRAYYLLEAYSDRDVPGTLILQVLDSSGAKLLQTAPATVRVPAGGGLLKGQVDLAGLPPGHYRMLAVLSLDGGPELQRSGEFDMAGFEETLQKDVARREAERDADEGYFAQMSDLDLDEAEAPLALIAGSPELRVYDSQMSPDAKRRFLTEFWARRDPTPGTVRNETRLAFYAAVDYANRVYREGGRNRLAGWRTDRGRIYVRNGPPSDILRRQQQGKAPPYEVWSYQTGKSRYYCFADRTGFGAYKLLYSNDIKETSMPNWRQILTEEAVTDIGRFLGIDFYSQSGPQ
jgi:GWxTD domain-containing protein